MRVLWLDAPPWDGESSSLGADIRITVEPREAVVSAIGSGSPREEEGQITSWGSGRTPILIDPPLVRRIHYRVERVDSKYEGTTTRLFVRGAPDSEHPELAPVFASVAVLFGVFGIVPSIVWLRSVRRNGPPASLEESIFTEK